MPKKTMEIATMKLPHTSKGTISIAHIEEPYGSFSSPVVSIGISLEGEDHDWKVHLPYENLDCVIQALQKAREESETMPRYDKHTMDLCADTGGGA